MSQPQPPKKPMTQEQKDYLKAYREKQKEFKQRASPEQRKAIKLLNKNLIEDKEFLSGIIEKVGPVAKAKKVTATPPSSQPPPIPSSSSPLSPSPPSFPYPQFTPQQYAMAFQQFQQYAQQQQQPTPTPPQQTLKPVAQSKPVSQSSSQPIDSQKRKRETERIVREALARGEIQPEDLDDEQDDYEDYQSRRLRRRSRIPNSTYV
ncbi:hypothetical protein FACS189472_13940 [Alphaproteobacteria bacterium]|nr:hypothetical protein FACS189472_13940 [Alphaproteobacteria bacterium]